MSVGVIDLFCGAGGLTNGLEAEGLDVLAGIDVDPSCEFPYEANNFARFFLENVGTVPGTLLDKIWGDTSVRVLAGCAPCQPFSKYTQGRDERDERWHLLDAFARLIDETQPQIVTMENVPELTRHEIHRAFVTRLEEAGFQLTQGVVECTEYGIPQHRRRLVLLASKLGPIDLIKPEAFGAAKSTVRDTIGGMPVLEAGAMDPIDRLHRSSALSAVNLQRIKASRPGGSWSDWDADLVAPCHTRTGGKGYRAVYGRMEWDKAAPTITTQSFGFGSGRFGHPDQNRALSLREAAMLQTFPRDYAFVPAEEPIQMKTIGRLIGNAVPVRLGRVVGRSIIRHLERTPSRTRGSEARQN